MTGKLGQLFENKEEYVQEVFASIAPVYDVMNRVMTLGLVRSWYRALLKIADPRPGDSILDAGTGTGEIALLFAEKTEPGGSVTGLDLSEKMLVIAREKLRKKRNRTALAPVTFMQGNILQMPFREETFDIVTTGFTLRNVADLIRGVKELTRVCKEGGQVVCLEISRPTGIGGRLFGLYFDRLVPLLGSLIGKGDEILGRYPAYSWLAHSTQDFPQDGEMEQIFRNSGLKDVASFPLSGGVVTIYKGKKEKASIDT